MAASLARLAKTMPMPIFGYVFSMNVWLLFDCVIAIHLDVFGNSLYLLCLLLCRTCVCILTEICLLIHNIGR